MGKARIGVKNWVHLYIAPWFNIKFISLVLHYVNNTGPHQVFKKGTRKLIQASYGHLTYFCGCVAILGLRVIFSASFAVTSVSS